jgi:hypothetical protein
VVAGDHQLVPHHIERTGLFDGKPVFRNIEDMELANFNLQLIGNVVSITAFTSLALICGLLKRDNDKLSAELLSARRLNAAQPSRRAAIAPTAPEEPVDIRQFVAKRAQNWVAAQHSATSAQ